MARGQKEAADTNLQKTNAAATQAGTQGTAMAQPYLDKSNSMFGLAAPVVQQMIQRPGYSDATKSMMRNDTLGGVASAYDATARNAANRATRTGNSAGYNDLAAELARSRARDSSTAAGDLNVQFENEANRHKEAGLNAASGLYDTSGKLGSSIYGIGQDTMSKLLGLGPSTLQSRAAGGGWSQGFKDVFGALLPRGA